MLPVLFGSYGEPGWEANTRNLDGFERIQLCPRVLVDVSKLDLATTVLGQPIALPVVTAPTGLHMRFHPEGEPATAQGTAAAGSLMVLSTAAGYSIEEMAELDAGPRWFQLYCFQDRDLTAELVRRAARSGYGAIVVTVDNPGVRNLERDHRHAFSWHGSGVVTAMDPERILRHFHGLEGPGIPTSETFHECFATALDWEYFDWLRSLTSLPFVVKGIQTAADAALAVEHGAEGIVVSNHGGHALHDCRASIDVLPEVIDVVDGRIEVYMDGGIRRGIDVLKCLALGARAVWIGRVYLFGLSVGGAAGVEHVYEILRRELEVAMRYCGVADVKNVPRSFVDDPQARSGGVASHLRELADLVEAGYLTRAEFDTLKQALLAPAARQPR
jgi:4-hydroxymandelate oxidase